MLKFSDEPWLDTHHSLTTPNSEFITLAETVANGRLFILNGRGEYEQVVLASYWSDHASYGHGILTACNAGYEYDEDGEETRRWKKE